MVDEGLMDYLHSEVVSYIFTSSKSDDKENCVTKLEHIGFSTGYRIIERQVETESCHLFGHIQYVLKQWSDCQFNCISKEMSYETYGTSFLVTCRICSPDIQKFELTREWPRFKDELDTVKFICKDFWMAVYKKQVDNLRTNHQGVYVLLDNQFRFITHMSAEKQYLDLGPRYVAFSCGLLRGALANLGVQSVVTAEITSMPACKFQIQVQRS